MRGFFMAMWSGRAVPSTCRMTVTPGPLHGMILQLPGDIGIAVIRRKQCV